MEEERKCVGRRWLRIILLVLLLAALPLGMFAASAAESPEVTNVARGKPVVGSGTSGTYTPARVTDGVVSSGNFWDGGTAPGWFLIDLEGEYVVSEIVAYPLCYNNDGRAYTYEIYVGKDKNVLTLAAEKKDDTPSTTAGDSYSFDIPLIVRYVYVKMLSNTKNNAVHMSELSVFGYENPGYVPPATGDFDTSDPENIAYKKAVRTDSGRETAANVTDGANIFYWEGEYYPSYAEVDLGEDCVLSDAVVSFPSDGTVYYYYTLYGSSDGENYRRLYQKRDSVPATAAGDRISLSGERCRFLRVSVEYRSDSGKAALAELRVHGQATGENETPKHTGDIEEILGVTSFDESVYAAPITGAETIENLYGIVSRTVGDAYRSWFLFELCERESGCADFFELSDTADGRIRIRGTSGVAIASGLNHYYKYYCKVHISEETIQGRMPATTPAVGGTVRKETPYRVRYAMNYCTLSYTFAFFDEEAWQRENDYLALNGVNVVLDLAGEEAVWVKFLMHFGYSFDDAKEWLTGPLYFPWQMMGNMEGYGGTLPDGYLRDRLEAARKSRRWKDSLGMSTVLQGYAGMVPTDFTEYQNVEVLRQGNWCGQRRPDMIRTDGTLYDTYAALFYECQAWAFGTSSRYYAVDPFHEGGIRPSDLSDSVIAKEVLDSLLAFDPEGVWVIQSWQKNPTEELLVGMGDRREEHALVLDLTAMYRNRWAGTKYGESYGATPLSSIEFDGTPWVWCLLKNYGANPSMDWDLSRLLREINAARGEAEHMQGIGLISEATYDNPVVYDLFFETVWQGDEPIDLGTWLDSYIERRYGTLTASGNAAWDLLLSTVYKRSGNTPYILAKRPENASPTDLPYSESDLEEALKLLLQDYELLSGCEGYRYDLTEIMRQIVNNYALITYNSMMDAYDAGQVALFRMYKERFLSCFEICDEVAGCAKGQLLGTWLSRAEAFGARYDDYSRDLFVLGAKALLTTWSSRDGAVSELLDYSYRNYQGMMCEVYRPRWEAYLAKLEGHLTEGTAVAASTRDEDFHAYWRWVTEEKTYATLPTDDRAAFSRVAARVISECTLSDDAGNIARGKSFEASFSGNSSYPPKNATDGQAGTYWDAGKWADSPSFVIDLGALYRLSKINVINYVNASRYYQYEVYLSTDGETYTLAYEKKDERVSIAAGYPTALAYPEARYVKVVGTYNSGNASFHIAEIAVYGTEVGTLLSEGKSVTANGEDTKYPARFATDGKTNTWWSFPDIPKEAGESTDALWRRLEEETERRPMLTVDLGGLCEIGKINVITYVGTGNYYERIYHYDLYVSADGVRYTKVAAKTDDSMPRAEGNDFCLSGVYGRYVRVVGTYHSRNTAFHITELRVFGREADATVRQGREALASLMSALPAGYDASLYTVQSRDAFESARTYAESLLASVRAGAFALEEAREELLRAYDALTYDFKIRGASLWISDDVSLVYTAVIPDGYDDAYMVFEFGGKRVRVLGVEAGDHTFAFRFEHILPQQFGDEVRATLYATRDGESVSVCRESYSVREYCIYGIENSENAALVTLLSDLLIYGARAQAVAGYRTDALVTDGVDLSHASGTPTISEEKNKLARTGEPSGEVAWRGAGLRLENRMALYLTFRAGSVAGLRVVVTFDGGERVYTEEDFVPRGDGYVLYVNGIPAAKYDAEVTARFEREGTLLGESLTYSVNSYLYAKAAGGEGDLAALLCAIYNYGESVRAYAATSGNE